MITFVVVVEVIMSSSNNKNYSKTCYCARFTIQKTETHFKAVSVNCNAANVLSGGLSSLLAS